MYATSWETTSTNLYARVDLFNCLFISFVNKSVIYNSLSLSSRQTDWLTDSPFTHLGLFIMQCDCCVTFYIKNTIFARLPSRFILIQFIHRPTDPTPISPAKPHLGRSLAAKRLFIDTDGWWYSIRTEPKPTALANMIFYDILFLKDVAISFKMIEILIKTSSLDILRRLYAPMDSLSLSTVYRIIL